MLTKRVPCWKDKQVLVSVYVERPKRRPASTTYHHQRHHHVRRTIKQEFIQIGDGAGSRGNSSRRAELLQYSQHLRQSAISALPSTAIVPEPNHSSNAAHGKVKEKGKTKKRGGSKLKAAMRSLKVQKLQGHFFNLFPASAKKK